LQTKLFQELEHLDIQGYLSSLAPPFDYFTESANIEYLEREQDFLTVLFEITYHARFYPFLFSTTETRHKTETGHIDYFEFSARIT
jgi:hypothetical protein